MSNVQKGYLISEKGRYAESAFQYCIEKYFPRSVFNPVSADEHGFDGNLILQADASKENTVSVYFQIKHTKVKTSDNNYISSKIDNMNTLYSLLQHDYPYLAIMDIDSCYNSLKTSQNEPNVYLINLRAYFKDKHKRKESITISVNKKNKLNIFNAQLLSATVWCHRYSELVKHYIENDLEEKSIIASVVGWINDLQAMKCPISKMSPPFKYSSDKFAKLPFYVRRRLNTFFGSLRFFHEALCILQMQGAPGKNFYTIANETLTGVEINHFIFLNTFQQYMNGLLSNIQRNNVKFYRTFIYSNIEEQYRAIHKLYFYYTSIYLMQKGIYINFSENWRRKGDYFLLENSKCIELSSYIGSEATYRLKYKSQFSGLQKDIFDLVKNINKIDDSKKKMLKTLGLDKIDSSNLRLKSINVPTIELFPTENWLYKIPDDYFKEIIKGTNR